MIQQLNNVFDKEIILPDAMSQDLTTSSRYSKVQGIYKVRCRASENTDICAYLCDTCKTSAESANVDVLAELIKGFMHTHFPMFDPDDNYVEMGDPSEIQRQRKRVEESTGKNNGKDGSTDKSS